MRDHDMTVAQFTVLHHVTKPALQSGTTLSNIAAAVEVNLPAVVKIINKFEKLGWVETQILTKRGRSRAVRATPHAQIALDAMKRSIGPFLHKLYGALPPEDVKTVTSAMQIMSEHIYAERSAPSNQAKRDT